MQITAAIARDIKAPLSIESFELEDPRDDEILVKLVATGICHTDAAMRDRQFPVPHPLVLGHEGAGIVERVGANVRKVQVGDHVIMHYDSCGACPSCIEHAPAYCHHFFKFNFSGLRGDGTATLQASHSPAFANFFGQSSFANFSLCRERNVVKVAHDLPLDVLAPIGCGIQTGAGAVLNALKVKVGDSLAVFGAGSVGLAAVMAARAAGATRIIAVDLNMARLEMARSLGATDTIHAGERNVVESIKALTGAGVAYAFDTTGHAKILRQCVDALAPRGVCGTVGVPAGEKDVTLDIVDVMTHGKTFRGIVQGESNPDVFFQQLIELYRQGRFPLDKLVAFYPFSEINRAMEDSESGKVVKAVLRF
ncbi:NAD(P)-dependent alcohol dehydrogenase [Caballeronia sp. LZ025]|uniref:NAD(P)-dependent alcohol dehydrogenase n=1 Tax=Caballeronia TaxID=1827195 RepID=UPI001FD62E12|nr:MULTISPECIES: NAD(P)-dependent alcohol dehydrogenase [Caballeronia]MDR5733915.1 NAD(P)-dependent alcohol dehydrogenase [Caballeronia sp. LZ025]